MKRKAIIIGIGIAFWLGGYAIKDTYVSNEIGKGISALGWLIIAILLFFEIKGTNKDNNNNNIIK